MGASSGKEGAEDAYVEELFGAGAWSDLLHNLGYITAHTAMVACNVQADIGSCEMVSGVHPFGSLTLVTGTYALTP